MKGFPALLRKDGYYSTNNVKTDYNSGNYEEIIKSSWNESSATAHWRNRVDRDKPFFSVFNLMTSHQSRSMVWPYERFQKEVQSKLTPEQIHDPNKITLPRYYPDTTIVRKTVARFHDCVTAMDKEVGDILKQLEEDGLADNTIVFFYSDHGSGMPRHKRALLDSGMHVPLLIRFPERWKKYAPAKSGETIDRLVTFVDFAPTVLSFRYWGAIGFCARKEKRSEKAKAALAKALKDSSPSVRIEAANALALQDQIDLGLPVPLRNSLIAERIPIT